MVQLSYGLVMDVVGRLPKELISLMEKYPIFLGGGFIRAVVAGEKPSDIDLFSPSRELAELYAEELAFTLGKGSFSTPNSISISYPETQIQFITRWSFSDAKSLIDSFDFTIAQAAVWFSQTYGQWRGIASDSFTFHTLSKQLVYTSPTREEDAAGSLLRVTKFLSRGYSIDDESLAKVVARVGEAANAEKKLLKEAAIDTNEVSIGTTDSVEPYRRVINKGRVPHGGSV